MKDLDKLIENEKEKVIARIKKEVEGLEKSIIDAGMKQFTDFADTLKIAYSARIIGPEDLLRTIEKGGFIYHRTNDTNDFDYKRMTVGHFLERLAQHQHFPVHDISGPQKVTIIIEPLEADR
jgi:uncharacterized protein related to proFAR isomerase